MYLYAPAASGGTVYWRWPGPVKNAVSPWTWTFEPSGFWRIRLCGAVGSWLSKISSNCVFAVPSAAFGSKPAVAAPDGAVIVIDPPGPPAPCDAAGLPFPDDGAAEVPVDGAADAPPEAPADGSPDAPPDGAGVVDGAGAYVQPGAPPAEQAARVAAVESVRIAVRRRRMSSTGPRNAGSGSGRSGPDDATGSV